MDVLETPVELRPSNGSAERWNINVDTGTGDTNGNLTFNANSPTAGNTRMVINDETGNVGIGTPTPQAPLHIYSPNNPTTLRIQSSAGFGAGRLEFWSDPQGSSPEWRPGFIQSTDQAGGTWTGGLAFFVNGTGFANRTAEIEVMRITNGRVGIRRSNPQATLDVNGTFRINEGTIFSRIQAGTATIGNSSSQRKNVIVNFPTPFSTLPKVTATARGGDFPDTFAVTTTAISNTQFRINVLRLDSTVGWGQNLQLDWMAWQQ